MPPQTTENTASGPQPQPTAEQAAEQFRQVFEQVLEQILPNYDWSTVKLPKLNPEQLQAGARAGVGASASTDVVNDPDIRQKAAESMTESLQRELPSFGANLGDLAKPREATTPSQPVRNPDELAARQKEVVAEMDALAKNRDFNNPQYKALAAEFSANAKAMMEQNRSSASSGFEEVGRRVVEGMAPIMTDAGQAMAEQLPKVDTSDIPTTPIPGPKGRP